MKHIKTSQSGFTLIELLVVIAIIGVLSSVVLASLNTARNKGADAAIKSNLAGARAEAEIYYDDATPSYDGVCAVTGANIVGDSVTAAASAGGVTFTNGDATASSATVATCHDSSAGWAAIVPLKAGSAYCVDATGAATTVAVTALAASDVTCN
ncbi:MAG: type II secretion system protein [Candidatus Paceibacterota bacterium]|jgi:prepilin-type N-terminal cleavage/methylation domain-containing protein